MSWVGASVVLLMSLLLLCNGGDGSGGDNSGGCRCSHERSAASAAGTFAAPGAAGGVLLLVVWCQHQTSPCDGPPAAGKWDALAAPELRCIDGDLWQAALQLPTGALSTVCDTVGPLRPQHATREGPARHGGAES